MRALAAVFLLLGFPGLPGALDLPGSVREAVLLELDGRTSEALEAYRSALATESSLVQDEDLSNPVSVFVLAKAAHLSIDLGYGEEAWDLGGRLLATKTQVSAEAGTLVRMRLLRLQGKAAQARSLFEAYIQSWPLPGPGPGLLAEMRLVASSLGKSSAAVELVLSNQKGPASEVLQGDWSLLPGPTEALGISVLDVVRIQVGAFKDWPNALTLVDMLREKGWSPLTDVKPGPGGTKLHSVYVVSRQPQADRARLAAQGLSTLP